MVLPPPYFVGELRIDYVEGWVTVARRPYGLPPTSTRCSTGS